MQEYQSGDLVVYYLSSSIWLTGIQCAIVQWGKVECRVTRGRIDFGWLIWNEDHPIGLSIFWQKALTFPSESIYGIVSYPVYVMSQGKCVVFIGQWLSSYRLSLDSTGFGGNTFNSCSGIFFINLWWLRMKNFCLQRLIRVRSERQKRRSLRWFPEFFGMR